MPTGAETPSLSNEAARRRETENRSSVHEVKAGSGGAICHTATPDRVLGLPGATEGWSGAEASEVTPTDLRGGGSHDAETEGTGLPGSA